MAGQDRGYNEPYEGGEPTPRGGITREAVGGAGATAAGLAALWKALNSDWGLRAMGVPHGEDLPSAAEMARQKTPPYPSEGWTFLREEAGRAGSAIGRGARVIGRLLGASPEWAGGRPSGGPIEGPPPPRGDFVAQYRAARAAQYEAWAAARRQAEQALGTAGMAASGGAKVIGQMLKRRR